MIPQRKGLASRQAHVDLPEGTVEEEHGRQAFTGRASHLYRTAPPTAWVKVEGPLHPWAFDWNLLTPPDQTDAEGDPLVVLSNRDLTVLVSRRSAPMPFFVRDADGDVVYFVHRGSGTLETDYGPLQFRPGDYLVVPKGTTHRVVPSTDDNFFLLISGDEFVLPDKGLLGHHALFDPGVLETPEPDPHDERGEFRVRVRRRGEVTTFTFPHHPLNVVGWQGDLTPYRLNVADFRPVVSPRYHLPPSVHTTFRCRGFDIATFAPRPFETEPGALRVPFYHSNIDNDELLFYHDGDFFSRKGIDRGMATLHPAGVHHGPQPGAAEGAATKEMTDEVAVMIECLEPLTVSPEAEKASIPAYATSWARGLGLLDE